MLKKVSLSCCCTLLMFAVSIPGHAIVYGTFLGGSDSDKASAFTMDGSGNLIVAGSTSSSDFPVTSGAYDNSHNGSTDGFVLKLTPDLSTILSATFIGGSNYEECSHITLDDMGFIIVSGITTSIEFPTTPGAYDETYNGGLKDVYVARFNPTLDSLVSSTFFGGGEEEEVHGMTLGETGNVLITGDTSSDTDFPVTPGAYDSTWNGGYYDEDGYLASLSGTLDTLEAATYLGGENFDTGQAVGSYLPGLVTVAGNTSSGNFPATLGTYDSTHNGASDIFVAHLTADLSALSAATFVGAEQYDKAYAMTFDSSSNEIVIAGNTTSADFPIIAEAYESTHNGEADGVVLKLAADLTTLNRSTFIGGDDYDFLLAVAVEADGAIAVCGHTWWTTGIAFPTTPWAYDTTMDGHTSAVVAKFDADLNSLLYSTFIGGEGIDTATDLLLVDAGRMYVTGQTASANFPVSDGAFDTTHNGSYDVFVLDLRLFDNVVTHYDCDPTSGTLPFSTAMTVILENQFDGLYRKIAAHIDLTLSNGSYFPNWRAGHSNVEGGGGYMGTWVQNLPALGSLAGENLFRVIAEDVTPAPYNQPPYPPSGDTDSASCTIIASTP